MFHNRAHLRSCMMSTLLLNSLIRRSGFLELTERANAETYKMVRTLVRSINDISRYCAVPYGQF